MLDGMSATASAMVLLLLMVLIFAGAYLATKFIGSRYTGQTGTAKKMDVLDRLMLGRDRFLLIVRIGEKVLLLGVTPQHVETLAELDPQGFGEAEAGSKGDFATLWQAVWKKGRPAIEDDGQADE